MQAVGGASAPAATGSGGSGGADWVESADAEGNVYYYNTATGETSWTAPPTGRSNVASNAESYYDSSFLGAGRGEWDVAYTSDGAVYYVNRSTGETSWDEPAGAAGGAAGEQSYGYGSEGGGEYWRKAIHRRLIHRFEIIVRINYSHL